MSGIVLNGIQKIFQQPYTHVLHDISLTIDPGEFISLTGRSGSGKSTLLYIISSLDSPTSGKIKISDVNINAMSVEELHRFRNLHMGFVFQSHHLLPELNALENVLMPTIKTKSSHQRKKYALDLLEEFGLSHRINNFPSQLSGGEQQRVAIARALVMEPDYLFADEPTGNLDSANSKTVMDLFAKINRERKTTIIYVTHDSGFAALAKRQIHLVDGRITQPSQPVSKQQ